MDRTGNLIGASASTLASAPSADNAPSLASFGACLNARSSIVEKHLGADPNLPGPGQYIDPIKEGRNANGEVKATLSHQRSTKSVVFGPAPEGDSGRSLVQPGAADEPGPGQYVDPLKEGRRDGEVHAVLSTQHNLNRVVFGKHKINRDLAKPGAQYEPGPGAYINPMKEGRNENGEVKATLSSQKSVASAVFGYPQGPQRAREQTRVRRRLARRRQAESPGPGAYINPLTEGRNANGESKALLSSQRSTLSTKFGRPSGKGNGRSLARPGAEKEPGPGQYINPLREGRTENGEVKATLSHQRSTQSIVFGKGTALRGNFESKFDKKPGPSAYKIPGSMGKQVISKYKTTPTARWGPPGR